MNREIIKFDIPELSLRYGKPIDLNKNGKKTFNHFHTEAEIVYADCGSVLCIVNKHNIVLNEGEVLFINSLIPHRITSNAEKSKCRILQIGIQSYIENSEEEKYISQLFYNNSSKPYFKFDKENGFEFINLIIHIWKEIDEQSPFCILFIKSYIYYMVAFLFRENILSEHRPQVSGKKKYLKLLPAIRYVNKNYAFEVTIETASEIMNLNKYYFCKLFKKLTGITFTEYVTFVRLTNADQLIANSDKNILEIAFDTGFSSVQYFNRVYKKYRGCSPTKYRKSLLSDFEK